MSISTSNKNRARNHHDARRRMRRRLEAAGVPAHLIEAAVDRLRKSQAAARKAGVTVDGLDAIHDRTHAELSPDDAGYRPDLGDPLQRGAARVNARTAAAARRRKATTRYELDRSEAS